MYTHIKSVQILISLLNNLILDMLLFHLEHEIQHWLEVLKMMSSFNAIQL